MSSYKIKTEKSWSQTNQELQHIFSRWGVTEWDTNYPKGARLEGMNQKPEDRGVTVTYKKDGKTIKLSMDLQSRAVDNVRVLYLAIEAMFMNERRGIAEVVANAYKQLTGEVAKRNPYEVLQIIDGSPIEVAEVVYKTLAKKYHPDNFGGNGEKMKELNEAIEEIRRTK